MHLNNNKLKKSYLTDWGKKTEKYPSGESSAVSLSTQTHEILIFITFYLLFSLLSCLINQPPDFTMLFSPWLKK